MTRNAAVAKFLDIRTHGFVRVATLSPRVHLSNPKKNALAHLDLLEEAKQHGVMYALCPELGLTGYTNGDLFFSEVLLDAAMDALQTLLERTKNWNMLITVGMPLRVDDLLFNALIAFHNGRILRVTPKMYPPNYREFYEGRHFAGAGEARTKAVILLGQEVPFGTDVLIRCRDFPYFVQHDSNCEDDWVTITPGDFAALAGATVCANASASNITIGKAEYRLTLMKTASGRRNCVQMYTSAGFGESSTDLAWDGHQIVAERGMVIGESGRFLQDDTLTIKDADLAACVQDRLQQTSFRQNAAHQRMAFREVTIPSLGSSTVETYFSFRRSIDPHPFVPADPAVRDERCYEAFHIQTTALARRLLSRSENDRKIVIGVSGGQDSTHALLVAVRTMDLLELPRTNVIAITMPGFGTTNRTYRNSLKLMRALGVTVKIIRIRHLANGMLRAAGHDLTTKNTTYQNVQAWIRKVLELSTGCEEGAIDLGTGDLSELMLGWCTMFGDHASHYGINAGVPKTLISFLIGWAAEVVFKDERKVQRILRDVLATPISPELLPSDADGAIVQKTESEIGPYELHDFTGYYLLRFGFRPYRIARLAHAAFGDAYDLETIVKWMGVFLRRFFGTQLKRSCLPDGPKVGLTAISPRGDWRMPSDTDVAAWIEDLDRVPVVL